MVAMIDLDMEAWPVFETFGLKMRRRENGLEEEKKRSRHEVKKRERKK